MLSINIPIIINLILKVKCNYLTLQVGRVVRTNKDCRNKIPLHLN